MRIAQKTKYAFILLGLTVAIVVSLSVAFLVEFSLVTKDLRETAAYSMDDALLQQYEIRALDLSTALSTSLVNSVYLLDVDMIRSVVVGISGLPDVNAIAVSDQRGLLYYWGHIPDLSDADFANHIAGESKAAERDPVTRFFPSSISATSPIRIGDSSIGSVMVNLSLTPITQELADVRVEQDWRIDAGLEKGLWVTLTIAASFCMLGVVMAVVIGDRLGRPIAALTRLARQVGRGNYQVPDDIESSGEIRDLVESFISMARDLRQTTVTKGYLDKILNGMLDGLLVVGPDMSIRTVNRASCRLLGYEEDELVGQPVTAFLEVPAAEPASGSVSRPREGVARVKGGGTLPVLVSSADLPEQQGAEPSSVWVFRDITRFKATQNALITAMQDAERANHAKSQFLANMSHELRTPLNAIIGYSEILLEETEESGATSMASDLRRVHAAGQHLLDLINDVLDLSKIEAGKMDLTVDTFDVPALVGEVVDTVQPLIDDNRNQLSVDCPSMPEPMYSDPIKIRQILVNILSNAAKFTRDGRITLAVRRETISDETSYIFTITDTGIGMNEAQLDRVFQEFLQADPSTTREYGGTGLGLAISRRMARILGGDISATSTPDEGATFTVRLPARVVNMGDSRIHGGSNARRRRASGRDSGWVVLVINDEVDALDTIGRNLTQWGFRVVNAVRGKEGIRFARELRPFAVIANDRLPDMDIRTLLQSMKSEPTTSRIPVVVSPANGASDELMSIGASSCVVSPEDCAGLFKALAAHLPVRPSQTALVVDDNPKSLAPLADSLREAGWSVIVAENSREALRQIRSAAPDFVVVDLPVSEIDTEIFLDTVRSANGHDSVPVVVLTDEPLSETARSELGGRADTVIDKGTNGWLEAVRVLSGSLGQRPSRTALIKEG